jgi:OmpA-OmpF porin, OOP family
VNRKLIALALASLAATLLPPTPAVAQEAHVPESNGDGMDTHLFRPAVDSKGFFYVNGTDIVAANKLSFGLQLDWGNNILRTNSAVTGTNQLIRNSFQGGLTASYGIADIMVVGLSLPLNLMSGDAATNIGPAGATYNTRPLNSQKLQTIAPHVKVRILRPTAPIGLAAVVQAGIPIGGGERDMGADPGFWYWPRLLVEKRTVDSAFKIGLDVGYRGHTGKNPTFAAGQLVEGQLTYGDLLTYGLGISYRALPLLDLVVENYGSYLLAANNDPRQMLSGEFLGGAKIFLEENSYLLAAGGTRANLFTGFQSADIRVTLGFVYEPSVGDRDGDGYRDDVDACPDDPEDFDHFEDADGCPEPDNDNDGLLDKVDRCPNIPEDFDGDEDKDGCPEGAKRGDRDGDGIYDDVDKCPDDPEDKDGFQDQDGCPEPDNDKDGILDKEDQCPDIKEDFDRFEDEDGCPEPDNDLDRIPDEDDRCPTDPEVYNGFQDEDGCPDKGKVIIDGSDIVILEKIQFATASDQILPASMPIIEAVVGTLKGHPEFLVLEIAGHADERGSDDYNLDLTKRRAASVRRALIQGGIKESRMVSQGYGEFCPLDDSSSPVAWDKNRRVDFKVVKTEDGPTGVKRGCEAARAGGIYPPPVP